MHRSKTVQTSRRSSRVPVAIPVQVTSVEPGGNFSEVCETLVVNAHGCALRSPRKLDSGVAMHLQLGPDRRAMAHVVDCQPLGANQGWWLGARLDQPDNFWGLKPCPEDWLRFLEPRMAGEHGPNGGAGKAVLPKMPMLREVVGELLQPLQAEVADLRERLGQAEPKRSSFEVSLSHIPPEVEEKLWLRLREELGAQVVQHTREQSKTLLADTKAAIEQKVNQGQEEFWQRASHQLQALEQHAKGLSDDLAGKLQHQVRNGVEGIQHQVLEGRARLDQHGEEFLRALRQRLSEEHEAHRRDTQKVQAAAASESLRLQAEIADLGIRVAKLNEAAGRLESDVETRLAQMAGDTALRARGQLESAVEGVIAGQLARLDEEISGNVRPLLSQSESLIGEARATADALRAENERASGQIAAVREEKQHLQQWLSEQAAAYKSELRGRLEQEIHQAASAAAARLEDELKASLTAHLEQARAGLNAEMERLLQGAKSLEKSLVQETGAWLAQQGATFQKQIHEAMTETNGRIRGRIDVALDEMASRTAKELGNQLEQACGRLQNVKSDIETSVSQSLRVQASDTTQSFAHSMEKLAHDSVERWRLALARDLNSLAKTLGEHFRLEAASDTREN